MAGMMYETYMLQALTNGLQSVQQDPSQLADILDALNPDELAAAQNYFSSLMINPVGNLPKGQSRIYVAPGFPMETGKMPFIGVTVANDEQIPTQTPIGLAYQRINNGDGTWTDVRGARFRGTLKATIYTPNADLVVWLSAICSWALLSQMDAIFIELAGMSTVLIGSGDYEPSPSWLPLFVFARGVWLSGEYDKTYINVPPMITSANITGTFTDISTLDS